MALNNFMFNIPPLSSNLKLRICSSIILIPILLAIIWLGDVYFSTLMIITAIIMSFEWNNIVTHKKALLTTKTLRNWLVAGIIYITIFCLSTLYLRNLDNGLTILCYLLVVIWVTDIAAYGCGKTFRGPKILPIISPNKTWAGLIGALLFVLLFCTILAFYLFHAPLLKIILIECLLVLLAQAGDFFESWIKRTFGVKDSSNIIPGHGGLLDRIDSLTFTAPALAILALMQEGNIF